MISKGTLVGSIVKHARASIKSRAPSSTRSFLSIADTVEEPLNPLSDLREMAHVKNLCDNQGYRVPDKHWTFVLSASDASNDKVGHKKFQHLHSDFHRFSFRYELVQKFSTVIFFRTNESI